MKLQGLKHSVLRLSLNYSIQKYVKTIEDSLLESETKFISSDISDELKITNRILEDVNFFIKTDYKNSSAIESVLVELSNRYPDTT